LPDDLAFGLVLGDELASTVADRAAPLASDEDAARRWAQSGAMALTGHDHQPPLMGSVGVSRVVDVAHHVLATSTSQWSAEPARLQAWPRDFLELLGERAALARLTRDGRRSCGGSTRLIRCRDGWIAVALPRPEDVSAVPAWLEVDAPSIGDQPDWDRLESHLARRSRTELVERAEMVGLAVSALGETQRSAVVALVHERLAAATPVRPPVIVDLSSLWAGPLCTNLLHTAGAVVVKVEASRRPDGLREDASGLFDLLHHGKLSVALDFTDASDLRSLRTLIDAADVVVEASRPRALAQLGIDAAAWVTAAGPRVWLSITAHGRTGAAANRIGFGDDAAVAGGLVALDRDGLPCFTADAVADPLTGMVAAAAVSAAWAAGGAWLLDVALAGVASTAAGPPARSTREVPISPPLARPFEGAAPRVGEHTLDTLAWASGPVNGRVPPRPQGRGRPQR
jgi:crotonobetainyl-CoA:carnitine CoA-transferase CaiB-like acyl-CoA transferase